MFVCVRYGDDDTVILNTDCGLNVFNDCLRRKCNIIESCKIIDLADKFGQVQYLSSKDPEERVSNILKERVKYVLVEIKTEKTGTVVEPLLKHWMPKSSAKRVSRK